MLSQMIVFRLFLWPSSVPLCGASRLLTQSSAQGTRCVHVLATVNNAVSVGLNGSLRIKVFKFLGKYPEERLPSHGNSNLSLLRSLHTIFHGVCTSGRSHQQ